MKKSGRAHLVAAVIVLLHVGAGLAQGAVVEFPDPKLDEIIRIMVDKFSGDLLASDLTGIDYLYAHERGIRDIRGLEHCVNLRAAYLFGNQITDPSPLRHLTKLGIVRLEHNQISSLDGLSGLQMDTSAGPGRVSTLLELSWNHIASAANAYAIKGLSHLGLAHNRITNLHGMEGLTLFGDCPGDYLLDVSSNEISDLTGLGGVRMEGRGKVTIDLSNNRLSTVMGIEGLHMLVDPAGQCRLDLRGNPLADITGLPGVRMVGGTCVIDLCGDPIDEATMFGPIQRAQSVGVRVLSGVLCDGPSPSRGTGLIPAAQSMQAISAMYSIYEAPVAVADGYAFAAAQGLLTISAIYSVYEAYQVSAAPFSGDWPMAIAACNGLACVASSDLTYDDTASMSYLDVYDIRSPAMPVLRGAYAAPGKATDAVFVARRSGFPTGPPSDCGPVGKPDLPPGRDAGAPNHAGAPNRAYVPWMEYTPGPWGPIESSLRVFDIGAADKPERVGTAPLEGVPGRVAVEDELAYVGCGDARTLPWGLQIFDLAACAAPQFAGVYYAAYPVIDVDVCGDLAYVLTWDGREWGTLEIVDAAYPPRPRLLSRYYYFDAAGTDVAVAEKLVYLSTVHDIRVLDVTSPFAPRLTGLDVARPLGKSLAGSNGLGYAVWRENAGVNPGAGNVSQPCGQSGLKVQSSVR